MLSNITISGHGAYCTEYHISWVTKYSSPVLKKSIRAYLHIVLRKVVETMAGCEIVACSVLKDHVHIIMTIPPKYAVSYVVGKLKGITSSYLKKRYDCFGKSVWSPGYFVKTVGIDRDKVINYVLNQD